MTQTDPVLRATIDDHASRLAGRLGRRDSVLTPATARRDRQAVPSLLPQPRTQEEPTLRITTDTLTGKPFRWNDTVQVNTATGPVIVPARYTTRTAEHLHPDRVTPRLLRELNPAREA